jgi:predicted PurR-regulated permease PerM
MPMQTYDRIAQHVGLTLLLVTLVGTAIACVVTVPDVFFLTFLAVLFGVFLSYTANHLVRWLPLSYGWNLGLLVLMICTATAVGGYFLASAIDAQITSAGKQIDRSASQIEQWLQERPDTREALAIVPFLDGFLEANRSTSESSLPATDQLSSQDSSNTQSSYTDNVEKTESKGVSKNQ